MPRKTSLLSGSRKPLISRKEGCEKSNHRMLALKVEMHMNGIILVWYWEEEPLEHFAWKARGASVQQFHSTRGHRDSTLGGHTRFNVHWGPGQSTYLQVLEGLLGRHGWK